MEEVVELVEAVERSFIHAPSLTMRDATAVLVLWGIAVAGVGPLASTTSEYDY